MTLLRTATISPEIFHARRALRCGRTSSVERSVSRPTQPAQRAPHAGRRNWRQTLADAYPIVGIALLLGYLVQTLASNLYLAD